MADKPTAERFTITLDDNSELVLCVRDRLPNEAELQRIHDVAKAANARAILDANLTTFFDLAPTSRFPSLVAVVDYVMALDPFSQGFVNVQLAPAIQAAGRIISARIRQSRQHMPRGVQ